VNVFSMVKRAQNYRRQREVSFQRESRDRNASSHLRDVQRVVPDHYHPSLTLLQHFVRWPGFAKKVVDGFRAFKLGGVTEFTLLIAGILTLPSLSRVIPVNFIIFVGASIALVLGYYLLLVDYRIFVFTMFSFETIFLLSISVSGFLLFIVLMQDIRIVGTCGFWVLTI